MREACRHDGRVALEDRVAQAFWMREAGCGEIRLVGLPEPGAGDGSAPYFGAAGCQVTSGGRGSGWIVCPRRTTLLRRETWCPGWSAEIDGRPTATHSADGLSQAVTVPAGSHHVRFSFVSPGVNWALLDCWGVALMLVPTARRGSSFPVRR